MKRGKRNGICALLAAALLLSLLAGCAPAETNEPPEEPADLTFYFYDTFMRGDKTEHIEAYANELVQAELGITLNVEWIAPREWDRTVQFAISSGESCDVVCLVEGNDVQRLAEQGMLMDVSELLPRYAPQALALMQPWLGAWQAEGGLYGVPTVRDFTQSQYLLLSGELLDQHGLRKKAVTMESFSQLEQLFEEVTAAEGNTTWAFGAKEGLWAAGFLSGADAFADTGTYDTLQDPLQLVGYADGQVFSVPRQEAYREACARVARWNNSGWLWPDSANTVEDHQNLLKRDVIFCSATTGTAGLELTTRQNADVMAVKLAEAPVTTARTGIWGVGVAASCEDPENACRFIELLYTNADLLMALVRGMEKEDYLLSVENIMLTDGYLQADDVIGNNALLMPLMGSDVEHYHKLAEKNAAAEKSPALGFGLYSGDNAAALAALSATRDRYHSQMVCGGYTEEFYEEYLAALDKAGLADYLADC